METLNYFELAKEKGAACGEYIAKLKTMHERDAFTIMNAATSFVNSLPLNDICLEQRISAAYQDAALSALKGKSFQPKGA